MNPTRAHKENSSIFLSRENWVPDSKAKSCSQCNREFIVAIARRHHCRMCGDVFCSRFLEEPFVFEDEKKIRVCDQCFESSQNQIKKICLDFGLNVRGGGSLSKQAVRHSMGVLPGFLTYKEQLFEINSNLSAMVQIASREILSYILKSAGLYESWWKVLNPLVIQPLFEVQTNPIEDEEAIDINRYIKIKKIPYRDKSQTQFVQGLVVRKNVSHKKMAANYENPAILMIGSSIEIYENSDITSMNQIIDNEKRQMTEIVRLILKCAPNILIVEKTVNRIVQQQLLKNNIAVLFKFKPSQFAKIAWETGAKVSTDLRKLEHDRESFLGKCELFQIINHENMEYYQKANEKGAAKYNLTNFDPSLLYIRNNKNLSKGATLTISGPDYAELQKIKECLRSYFRCARVIVLEKELILQDIFLYHSQKEIKQMILMAQDSNSVEDSILDSTITGSEVIDYTEIFSKAEFSGDKGANHGLFCKQTIESAGYFTRFLAITPILEDQIRQKEINFTFLERTIMTFEDHIDIDSLNKLETDAMMAEVKKRPRGHLDFLSQPCSAPVFMSEKLPSSHELCLGQYIKKRIELLDSKCEKCKQPGYMHTSFYYREGFFIKISSELTGSAKEVFSTNKKKYKPERNDRNENGNPVFKDSVISNLHNEEEPGSGNYFSNFFNFFSRKEDSEEVRRSPMKQMNLSSAHNTNSLNMYLECNDCKRRVSDEFQISKGYLEYSLLRYLEQFIRSGETAQVSLQDPMIEKHSQSLIGLENSPKKSRRPNYNHRECLHSCSKSRVFKYQEALIRFSRGITPVYKLNYTPYASTRGMELMKQAEARTINFKAEAAKTALNRYYELVSGSVLKLIELLLDRTQFSISHDETIDDIVSLLNKKTIFSNAPQNQLFRDFILILKNLVSIKDQIDLKFSQNFSNHIEVDIQREGLYHQIKETAETADLARSEYLNSSKLPMLESTKLSKNTSQVNDLVELNDVSPKLSPKSSIVEKKTDCAEQTLNNRPLLKVLSESSRINARVSSPNRVSESPEDHGKKKISHLAELDLSSGVERERANAMELVFENSSMLEKANSTIVTKPPHKALEPFRKNRPNIQVENPDAKEIELLKLIFAGFITYDEDPDDYKYQKFPVIPVLENDPVSFIAFSLNCSTYMKEVYLKNEFKEMEKLANSDQLLRTHGPALKIKLFRSDENPLTIKSKAQENQIKGICGIVESLIQELVPTNTSKKVASLPNFDLINDITGLIDLGLPSQIKNSVIEHLIYKEFNVNIYYPLQFQTLRLLHGITHSDFIKSIAKTFDYSELSGGKSNASFMKSHDGIYILKDMKKYEFKMLKSMIYEYFKYMWEVRMGEHPSLLAKIYGMYEVSVKDGEKYHYILMENLFHDTVPTRTYDLKGSKTNRLILNAKPGKTLLDTNFKIDQNGEPICLERSKCREVFQALQKDAEFLTSMNRIDYSLLLILDDERRVCKLGIIDYLREYTFDKRLESVGKKIITGTDPTIIKSSLYKNRFLSALEMVLMEVEIKKDQEKTPEKFAKVEKKVNGLS